MRRHYKRVGQPHLKGRASEFSLLCCLRKSGTSRGPLGSAPTDIKLMKRHIGHWLLLSSMLTWISCGYTIVQKPPQANASPVSVQEALPDLVIEGATDSTDLDRWMDGPGPSLTTKFWVQIANRGTAPFAGRVAIAWTDDPDEIRYKLVRYVGNEQFANILPESTLTLRASKVNLSYPPGTRLLFALLTESFESWMTPPPYKFGTTPCRELNVENNFIVYTVE